DADRRAQEFRRHDAVRLARPRVPARLEQQGSGTRRRERHRCPCPRLSRFLRRIRGPDRPRSPRRPRVNPSNLWNLWNPWNLCIIRTSGGNTVMAKQGLLLFGALVIAGAATVSAQQQKGEVRTAKPISQSDLPAQLRPEAKIVKGYVPPKTAWGDPQIAGAYTNSDESGIPFERPAEFDGKKVGDVTPEQLAAMVKQRQAQARAGPPGLSEFPGATSPLHWFENYRAANSRAWLVTDDTDGKVPATLPEAESRNAERQRLRRARGPADGPEDRS